MDTTMMTTKLTQGIKKYRYALLVALIGLALMLIPTGSRMSSAEPVQTTPAAKQEQRSVSEELAQILSQIQGAGDVKVMLTVSSGEKTVYQMDQDLSDGSKRYETVIISDPERGEAGLVQQVTPAVYQGAIIVCRGADSAAVRLAIVEAVARVTGLGADRISVLKMK